MKNIIVLLYCTKLGILGMLRLQEFNVAMIPDDNNAREIIRYFIDVQKRGKFFGVISSHAADTQTDIFPTCTLQREKGVISFHVQKILLLFSI